MISVDDAIFYGSLVTCISLGNYYKKINDADMKRNYGAGLGLLIACLICGQYIYHTIFMVWGNIIIIKCCNKRYIHQVSLGFTWAYLIFLHLSMYPLYIYWLHQVLAMRLVGLAFEVYNMNKNKLEPKLISTIKTTSSSAGGDDDTVTAEPSSVDIIAYAYFFIGLHKGPYYRWKIFNDHFTMPFGELGDSRIITETKLKKVCLCAVTYGILSLKYSTEVFYKDDFYKTYGTDFRYLYNIPLLIMYFLKAQIVMLLCTSVCTETGFGVYPAKCQAVPGHGPTANFNLLKLPIGADSSALDQEYNFSMLKCYDTEKLLIGPKMKDTLRNWNLSHRYWFWTYTHQSFWKDQKEVRSAFAFLAWMIWFGLSIPKLIMATTIWVYVRLEAEYNELYDTRNESRSIKLPMDIGYSIMRLFCLIYLTPCLVIPDTDVVFRYYHSIFWIYHILLLFMILLSILIYKSRDSGNI